MRKCRHLVLEEKVFHDRYWRSLDEPWLLINIHVDDLQFYIYINCLLQIVFCSKESQLPEDNMR